MSSKFTHILSNDEVLALMRASVAAEKGPSKWFVLRSAYLLLVSLFLLSLLTVFRERFLDFFSIEGALAHTVIDSYILIRVGYAVLLVSVYSYSFLKKWYFYYVSLAAFVIAVMNMVLDLSLGYVISHNGAGLFFGAVIAIRLTIIVCLFLNFWDYRKR